MLGSLSPLGQWARNSHWGTTILAYLVGSTLGGLLVGGLLGAAGELGAATVGRSALQTIGLTLLAIGAITGTLADAHLLGLRLPSVRRQVNQGWRDRYRGWVYGFGYGFQLGLGVVTIVTVAAVYLALVAAFASGKWTTGASIGAAFGILRASTILAVAPIRRFDQFETIDVTLGRWADRSRETAIAAEMALGTLLGLVLVFGVA